MRRFVESVHSTWWKTLSEIEVCALHSFGSTEHWFQFDLARAMELTNARARRGLRIRCESGDGKPDIAVRRPGDDENDGELQIECKILWNNKNLWATTESVITDANRLLGRRGSGYLCLYPAFYNRWYEANELNPAFQWTSNGSRLQPMADSKPFPPFARDLWKQVTEHIQKECGLERIPRVSLKRTTHDAWLGGMIWPVK